jgi:hypothetical protein
MQPFLCLSVAEFKPVLGKYLSFEEGAFHSIYVVGLH